MIGDPLYRFGDDQYSWVGRTNFSYSPDFNLNATHLNAKDIFLIVEGAETNATVYVNGIVVGVLADSWLRYTFDVKSALLVGTNTLRVAFLSVYDACRFTDPSESL